MTYAAFSHHGTAHNGHSHGVARIVDAVRAFMTAWIEKSRLHGFI